MEMKQATEAPAEAPEPVEAPEAPEPVEAEAVVPAEPKPRRIRARAPKARAQAPSEPLTLEIDGTFWAGLLRTQCEAERATRLQRISEFNLL